MIDTQFENTISILQTFSSSSICFCSAEHGGLDDALDEWGTAVGGWAILPEVCSLARSGIILKLSAGEDELVWFGTFI
jgi:hypothetical protein